MNNKNEKVLDKDLEKVAGGCWECFEPHFLSDCIICNLDLTQEEYNCLKNDGLISDKERTEEYYTFESRDSFWELSKHLKDKGYKVEAHAWEPDAVHLNCKIKR